MKLLIGWIAGIATAWTMLAIWRRIPPFPDDDLDPDDVPPITPAEGGYERY